KNLPVRSGMFTAIRKLDHSRLPQRARRNPVVAIFGPKSHQGLGFRSARTHGRRWQGEAKYGSPTGPVFGPDSSFVDINDGMGDGKPESRSPLLRRRKRLEYAFQLVFRNTGSGVANTDGHLRSSRQHSPEFQLTLIGE